MLIASGEIGSRIIFAKWNRGSIYLRRGYIGSKHFVIEPPNDVSVRSVNFSRVRTGILDNDTIQKGIEGFQDFQIEVFGRKDVSKNYLLKKWCVLMVRE
ncbi:MAG: hypothetical protein ACK4E1_04545 [Fervidobacterium nodosum]